MTGYSHEDLHAGRLNVMHLMAPEYRDRTQQAHQELASHELRNPLTRVGCILSVDVSQQANEPPAPTTPLARVVGGRDRMAVTPREYSRPPLTALKLQTTLLHRQLARQGTLDEAPALASMETQINRVTRLVEELLGVSKIQAGGLEYVWQPVDLDALLREVAETMQQTHPSHRILVRGAMQTTLPGDRDRLGQVFTNLLSNAIKFSPDAETVEVDLSASPETMTIRVRDHGLGIPREQRDKTFERFYRAAGPKQKAITGLQQVEAISVRKLQDFAFPRFLCPGVRFLFARNLDVTRDTDRQATLKIRQTHRW